jgi:hypothetical protein
VTDLALGAGDRFAETVQQVGQSEAPVWNTASSDGSLRRRGAIRILLNLFRDLSTGVFLTFKAR